jgi:tRNA(Ile)-lysidine synthase
MLSTVLRTIAAHELFSRGDRVVVAVSGGPDSMALLSVLWELHERLGLTLEVAGVDHGLRAGAAAELEQVAARASALDLPFFRLRVADEIAAGRRRRGAGVQEAARDARLAALAALAAAHGAGKVALGHQADDQVETVLFRILRGTGVGGLAGIPYRRDPFVRPLLDVRRAEILRYLRRRSIPFVEDPTNADPRFARARLRHRIIPMLAEENPRVAEAILALGSSARDLASGDLPAFSPRVAAAVRRLGRRGGTGRIDLPGGQRVEVSYGKVRVAASGRRARPAPATVTIDGPGLYPWSATASLEIRVGRWVSTDGVFDADAIAWPLVARTRRPGDRMRPRGGPGSRKLSDLMIDAKIAQPARAHLPVLTTASGQVLFVPGLRPSEVGRCTPATRRALRIVFQDKGSV